MILVVGCVMPVASYMLLRSQPQTAPGGVARGREKKRKKPHAPTFAAFLNLASLP